MPALEALLAKFEAANTQPLGLSIDSVYCHANWAASLGGVSFPLLADFHPKGEVATAYGIYLDQAGLSDRATVIIDAGGTVRYAESVTPAGKRDMAELLAECEKVDAAYDGQLPAATAPAGLESDAVLYVRNNCAASGATLLARENLHLGDKLPVVNVSEDAAAMERLKAASGKEQAPCLAVGGKVILESADIIAHLVEKSVAL